MSRRAYPGVAPCTRIAGHEGPCAHSAASLPPEVTPWATASRTFAALADQLAVDRLTAAVAEGPWEVQEKNGVWWVHDFEDYHGPFATEREAIMVCGALNIAARQGGS